MGSCLKKKAYYLYTDREHAQSYVNWNKKCKTVQYVQFATTLRKNTQKYIYINIYLYTYIYKQIYMLIVNETSLEIGTRN